MRMMTGKTILILKMKTSSKTMSMQINKNEESLPLVWNVLLYAFIVVVGVAFFALMIYIGYKIVSFVSGLFGVSMLAAFFISIAFEFLFGVICALLGLLK